MAALLLGQRKTNYIAARRDSNKLFRIDGETHRRRGNILPCVEMPQRLAGLCINGFKRSRIIAEENPISRQRKTKDSDSKNQQAARPEFGGSLRSCACLWRFVEFGWSSTCRRGQGQSGIYEQPGDRAKAGGRGGDVESRAPAKSIGEEWSEGHGNHPADLIGHIHKPGEGARGLAAEVRGDGPESAL